MADWLNGLKGLANGLAGLWGGKRKFNKISGDEIRAERIRLDQTEIKLLSEIEGIEKEKKQLFEQGASESSQRMQLVLARKIKELDSRAKGRDKQLAMLSRQTRVLSGLAMLKENDTLLTEMGISNLIGSMDMTDLEKYIERASVDGELQMEKLGAILEVVEGAEGVLVGQDEEDDTLAIMSAMQQARAEQDTGNETAIDEGLKSTQEVLDRKKLEDEGI